MGRPKGSGQGLVPLGLKVEADLFNALMEYADSNGMSASEAGRKLLRVALIDDGARLGGLASDNLQDEGYNEGLRHGLHDLRVALHRAMTKLWKQ